MDERVAHVDEGVLRNQLHFIKKHLAHLILPSPWIVLYTPLLHDIDVIHGSAAVYYISDYSQIITLLSTCVKLI